MKNNILSYFWGVFSLIFAVNRFGSFNFFFFVFFRCCSWEKKVKFINSMWFNKLVIITHNAYIADDDVERLIYINPVRSFIRSQRTFRSLFFFFLFITWVIIKMLLNEHIKFIFIICSIGFFSSFNICLFWDCFFFFCFGFAWFD